MLDAAENVVRMRGYDGFSYADLAGAVGIRKASIHHHFPAKQDLATAIVARYAARVVQRLDVVADSAASGGAAITSFVTLYRDASGDGDMLCLCVAMCLNRDILGDAAQQELNAFHRLALDWLEAQFNRAKEDASFAAVQDARSEAMACLAQVEGAQIIARAAGDVRQFDAAMAALLARKKGTIK